MSSELSELAIHGGAPVRTNLLPYGRQDVDEDDIQAVIDVLRSNWLTTGPAIDEFEAAFAETVGAAQAVAVSSGTAALHAAMHAIGLKQGDEVVVPTMTFAATANAVVYVGATPVFADVDPETLLISSESITTRITSRTRALVAVDYAGQPCDYDALGAIASDHNLFLIDDAAHSLGGSFRGRPVGSLADLNTFSFHPVKHITSGEGGMVTTDDSVLADKMRAFRNHGITSDHRQRAERGTFSYEMVDLGYNYRLTDFQSALGLRQLSKLQRSIAKRREIAHLYTSALGEFAGIYPLRVQNGVDHAYHLYPVLLEAEIFPDRAGVFAALRAEGIGVNVHYLPVHLHRFYRDQFGTERGLCPVAEDAYERLLSLPIFPAMTDGDVRDVLRAMKKVVCGYTR